MFDVITPPNKIKSKDFLESGKFPIIDQSNDYISGFWNNSNDCVEIEKPVIIFGDHTKNVKYIDGDISYKTSIDKAVKGETELYDCAGVLGTHE